MKVDDDDDDDDDDNDNDNYTYDCVLFISNRIRTTTNTTQHNTNKNTIKTNNLHTHNNQITDPSLYTISISMKPNAKIMTTAIDQYYYRKD